jgi:hypothetical protein
VSAVGGDRSRKSLRRAAVLNSADLPDRPGPDSECDALIGSGFPTSEALIAAQEIYFIAAGIHAVANRTCNQLVVAVIAGEGGGSNGSLACIAADAVLVVAKITLDKISSCYRDFGYRTADTSYDRLDHIHTDLENSVANDNANKDTIISNDNTNTISIIANSNANRGDVIVSANANTGTINAATTAAKVELRDLILRTQIEADLAATPIVVALYETPTANGGYLDLVRDIVAQTIANIQAAGGSTGQAQSLLTQGDTFKNSGDFVNAYAYYQRAYKAAVS